MVAVLFNSGAFCAFFPVVTLLYFLLPHRGRWALLLAASCYFYMAFIPKYILILFFTVTVDYFSGLWIEGAKGPRRRLFLASSLAANVGVLAFFKYSRFAAENIAWLAGRFGLPFQAPPIFLTLILPVGLSFHTFQSMSYTIEVYRGRFKAERHPGLLALYVLFYPQLVAGPIERPQNLLPQFRERHFLEYERAVEGLLQMAWGFFKKVVIADHLALCVNPVFQYPRQHAGPVLLLATFFFAYQIYCDFSGYSDIALGAARVMGINLMKNFNRPYSARSISEFWKRWHISLSTWFRDYLYIPLGGNRVSSGRWQCNLFVTFLLSGLWHGANWTYAVWGALHGLYYSLSIWTRFPRESLSRFCRLESFPLVHASLQRLAVFSAVCFAWIFFRANSLSDAWHVATHLHAGFSGLLSPSSFFPELHRTLEAAGLSPGRVARLFASILLLEWVEGLQGESSLREALRARPAWVRWPAYYALAAGILAFGVFNESQFIYFQF